MQKKGKSYNIFVYKPEERDRPSAHVVDLLSVNEKEEEIQEDENIVYKRIENLRKKYFQNKENTDEELYSQAEYQFKNKISVIKETALFQFFKAVFLLFKKAFYFSYKIVYYASWLFMFVPRFLYFFFAKIFSSFEFVKNKEKEEDVYLGYTREAYVPREYKGSFTEDDFAKAFSNLDSSKEGMDTVQEEDDYEAEQIFYTNKKYPTQTKRRIAIKDLIPEFSFYNLRPVLISAGIMMLIILPFKAFTYFGVIKDFGGRVLGASESAVSGLLNAKDAATEKDFFEAAERFADAKDNFLNAQRDIDIISSQLQFISTIIPNSKLKLASEVDEVLEAGVISSEIGEEISLMFEDFNKLEEKSIKDSFLIFRDYLPRIHTQSTKLLEVLEGIDEDSVPVDQREQFVLLRDKTRLINNSFSEIIDLLAKMEIFLGFEKDKRYLLVFQNNSEMRGSGGFMGSYALVDFRNGEILNIEVPDGGTYDTEGAFYEQIVSPEPLHILNPSWHFWDANWWPDWKKTAKKLEWFYERSGGSSVDGVIALTPDVIERLLAIIGPLDMQASHGVTVDSENFWQTTQTFAEQKPFDHPAYEPLPYEVATSSNDEIDPGKKPKKIIGDLIAVLKEEVPKRLTKEMLFSVLASIEQSLSEKYVLFYFDDWELQNTVEELSWAGRVKKTTWDYLMLVNTNIGGGKSDRVIDQKIEHHSQVREDGRILNTLKIKRTHNGEKGNNFTGVRNMSWMRIYVPLGSEFIEAKGFWPPEESLFEKPEDSWKHDPDLANSEENFIRDRQSWTKIYTEDNKTVFANWAQVDPGKSVTIEIKYLLPFGISKTDLEANVEVPHALLYEKQPGAFESDFYSALDLGPYQTEAVYPVDFISDYGGWDIEETLNSDRFWAITIKK